MYEGHMDKTKGGGFEGERQEWVRQGGTWWGENGGKCTWTTIKNLIFLKRYCSWYLSENKCITKCPKLRFWNSTFSFQSPLGIPMFPRNAAFGHLGSFHSKYLSLLSVMVRGMSREVIQTERLGRKSTKWVVFMVLQSKLQLNYLRNKSVLAPLSDVNESRLFVLFQWCPRIAHF